MKSGIHSRHRRGRVHPDRGEGGGARLGVVEGAEGGGEAGRLAVVRKGRRRCSLGECLRCL